MCVYVCVCVVYVCGISPRTRILIDIDGTARDEKSRTLTEIYLHNLVVSTIRRFRQLMWRVHECMFSACTCITKGGFRWFTKRYNRPPFLLPGTSPSFARGLHYGRPSRPAAQRSRPLRVAVVATPVARCRRTGYRQNHSAKQILGMSIIKISWR